MLKEVKVRDAFLRARSPRKLVALGFAFAISLAVGCSGAPQQADPEAGFSVDQQTGNAPLVVNCSNSSHNADSFQWEFGDGITASTANVIDPVTHQYTKAGTYTIKMAATRTGQTPKTSEKSVAVTVLAGPVDRVKVSPATVKLDIGQSQEFIVEAMDAFDNAVPGVKLTWDATGVGTISERTFKAGTKSGAYDKGITVTASDGIKSATASASITINPGPPKTVEIPPVEIAAGQTRQLQPVVRDQYGNQMGNVEASWTVKDENSGSITKAGLLTASEIAGTYADALEVQVKQESGSLSAKGPVKLVAGDLQQVVVAPNPIKLGIGMTQQFVAVGADKFGNRLTGLDFKWTASKGGSIDGKGLFAAGTTPGTYNDAVKVEAAAKGSSVSAAASVTVEPDRIMFISNRNDSQRDIYIMDIDGTNVKRLTNSSTYKYRISISPDGRRFLFDSISSSGGVMIMNDDGGRQSKLIASSSEILYMQPAWSPDGNQIVFSVARPIKGKTAGIESKLSVADIDGGNQKEIYSNAGAFSENPAWSADGKLIAFECNGSAQFGVQTAYADGSASRQLMTMWGTTRHPSWSPDGKKIAFQSYKMGDNSTKQYEIFISDSDGRNVQQLTANAVNDSDPSWSSDSKVILFASERDSKGKTQIYMMDTEGKHIVRLTNNEASDVCPQWMPHKGGVTVTDASVVISNSAAPKKVMTAQELTVKARKAVVRIKTDLGSGTGFIVDSSGVITTCDHVIRDAKTIDVYLDDGSKYSGTVKWKDMMHDVALLTIDKSSLISLEFGDLGRVSMGQSVVVLGYALNSESVSVSSGLVSTTKYDSGTNVTLVQTDSAINPGNSGGPLLTLDGRVIGIVSSKLAGIGIEGVGFAISANSVQAYMPALGDIRNSAQK